MGENKHLDKNRGRQLSKKFEDRPWAKQLESLTGKPITRRSDIVSTRSIVYLLLDISESMSEPAKINQAIEGAKDFAKDAIGKKYEIGLIMFSTDAHEVCSYTSDVNIVLSSLSDAVPDGLTNMSKALTLATRILEGKRGLRVICLFTDGWPNDPEDTLQAAKLAKDAGIDIITMGTQDCDYNFLSKLASREQLTQIVSSEKINIGFKSMAKLLPPPPE